MGRVYIRLWRSTPSGGRRRATSHDRRLPEIREKEQDAPKSPRDIDRGPRSSAAVRTPYFRIDHLQANDPGPVQRLSGLRGHRLVPLRIDLGPDRDPTTAAGYTSGNFADGTYELRATAAGFSATYTNVTINGASSTTTMSLSRSSSGSFPTPIRHVVVIMDENAAIAAALAQPFFSYLAHTYAYSDNFFAVHHNSLNDYIAATSGVTSLAFNQTETNIGDLLDTAGLSWGSFMQSIPYPCDVTNTTLYNPGHDPFIHYQDIASNPSVCKAKVLPLTNFSADVNASALPAYSWISPNQIDDGHGAPGPGNLTAANDWLKSFLSPLVNDSSIFSNTVFFITFDEGYGNLPYGTGGGSTSRSRSARTPAMVSPP